MKTKIYSLIAVAALVIVLIVNSIPQQSIVKIVIAQGIDPTFTFEVSGITGSSSSPVLTVDGIDYFPDAFPLTFNWENGTTHSYQWWETVTTSEGKFALSEVSGFSNETSLIFVMPDENCSITANYTQTHVAITFNATGLGDDVPDYTQILTVEGVDYTLDQLPLKLYVEINRSVAYVFREVVYGSSHVYTTVHCEGLVTETGGVFTASQSGTITAIYGTGNRTITFSAEFPENLPNQLILTVDGIDFTLNDLPYNFTWEYGTTHYYTWVNSLVDAENQTYAYIGCGGLSDKQSDAILVEISGEIHAVYSSTPQAPEEGEEEETPTGGWGSVQIGDGTGSTATHFPSQNHIFFAKNRYWCFFVNKQGVFGYKTVSTSGKISDFTPIRLVVGDNTYDVFSGDAKYAVAYYEPEREYVHIAFYPGQSIDGDRNIWYRLGALQNDGSISWIADWDRIGGIEPYSGADKIWGIDLAADSDGYPHLVAWGILQVTGYGSGGKAVATWSKYNNGTFDSAGYKQFSVIGTSTDAGMSIVRLEQKRMLAVVYYYYSGYKLRSWLFDGSWGSRVDIVPSSSDPLMLSGSSLSVSAYENTAILSYLRTDGIYLHKYVYGQGWSAACVITENFDTESYPAVTLMNATYAEVFWGYGSIIYRAEYDCTSNSITNSAAIYGQESLDETSLNAMEYRVNDHAGLLYVHQVDVDSAKVHLLYYPYAGSQQITPPQFILPILPIIGIIGIILMIVSPTMMIKKIREKDFDRALDFFVYLLIGFALFLAWAIGV